jgi:hypothetical protein
MNDFSNNQQVLVQKLIHRQGTPQPTLPKTNLSIEELKLYKLYKLRLIDHLLLSNFQHNSHAELMNLVDEHILLGHLREKISSVSYQSAIINIYADRDIMLRRIYKLELRVAGLKEAYDRWYAADTALLNQSILPN